MLYSKNGSVHIRPRILFYMWGYYAPATIASQSASFPEPTIAAYVRI